MSDMGLQGGLVKAKCCGAAIFNPNVIKFPIIFKG
jgi:hypothetical protein